MSKGKFHCMGAMRRLYVHSNEKQRLIPIGHVCLYCNKVGYTVSKKRLDKIQGKTTFIQVQTATKRTWKKIGKVE